MNDQKQLTLNVKPESLEEINQMATKLGTNQAGVISQALALFKVIQGKKVLIQDPKTKVNLEINKYADKPA